MELLEKKLIKLKSLEFLHKEEYKNFIFRANDIEKQLKNRELQ
jgi:hypothetical protein